MKKTFCVTGVDCANCAAKIERGIQKISGVTDASLNFLTCKLEIVADDEAMPQVMADAEKVIRKLEPDAVMKKA